MDDQTLPPYPPAIQSINVICTLGVEKVTPDELTRIAQLVYALLTAGLSEYEIVNRLLVSE